MRRVALTDPEPLSPAEHELAAIGAGLVAAALARPEARAPLRLRDSIARDRARLADRRGARGRWAIVPASALAAALAGVVLAGGTATPTVGQVAHVARLPTMAPASLVGAGAARHVAVATDGPAFPDWTARFGWRAAGTRSDTVAGREITTVRYRNRAGTTLGYAIVTGAAIRTGAPRFRITRRAGRTTVTWTRSGRTCVLDAPAAVPVRALLAMARWDPS